MQKINLDRIAHIFNIILTNIFTFYSTLVSRVLMGWWRINLEGKIYCVGIPIIRRHPGSQIYIKGPLTLRSSTTSNLIGINRPCYICTLSSDAEIIIGENVGVSGSVISAQRSIKIGSDVLIGANCTITDTDWHRSLAGQRLLNMAGVAAPVQIGESVWLGAGVTVLKGVTIGARSVIAANSVVINDIPADCIAAGNPARKIKAIDNKVASMDPSDAQLSDVI